MRTPEFWYEPPGWQARLLAPAAALYGAAARLRRSLARPVVLPVPALCVGNLVAGGAGKTPTVLALALLLAEAGGAPHIVSRGYGGTAKGPLRVDPGRHAAREVGDEPLLLAGAAPTWVARDRAAGARAAVAAGAGLVLFDDGFQSGAVAFDLAILVADGAAGFGNRRLLPAGPLREALATGLARADAVIVVGRDAAGIAAEAHCPVLAARLEPAPGAERLAGRRVLAFAGIGRPGKFFATLRELGCKVLETRAFPDHHRYRPEELMELVDRAVALGAVPVTTEKDFVRLPEEARAMVEKVPVALAFADEGAVLGLLRPLIERARRAR